MSVWSETENRESENRTHTHTLTYTPKVASETFGFFLNKTVIVEIERCRIPGKLLGYQDGSRKPHKPSIIVLETELGRVLVRGNWDSIGTFKR